MDQALILAILAVGATVSWAQTATPRFVAPLRPLLESMDRAKVSGSLAFLGHCDPSTPPAFPKFRAPSSTADSLLEIARETFADDKAMKAWQGRDGTLRMMETGVPTELLNVKISHISFEANATAIEVIRHVILLAPEVVSFMKSHEIETPLGEGLSRGYGPSGHPIVPNHISESMYDVTVSEALDGVLKIFPGIWVYESCPQDNGKEFVNFLFFDLQHPGLFEEHSEVR